MLGRQSALCKEEWTRSLSHGAICKTSYCVRSSSRQKCKNAWFLLGLRAHVAVSQCHSDMSGDMLACVQTKLNSS